MKSSVSNLVAWLRCCMLKHAVAHSFQKQTGDMFEYCSVDDPDPVMDLAESAESIGVLLRLLHSPPQPWSHADGHQVPGSPVEGAIPLPILRISLELVDKYALSQTIAKNLHTHLEGHVGTAPLQVYGMASALGLKPLASLASMNLLYPPVATYTLEQIREVPTAEALHRLVVLQARREPLLKEVVLNERLFPHDYGKCATHGKRLAASWEARKAALAPKVKAGVAKPFGVTFRC